MPISLLHRIVLEIDLPRYTNTLYISVLAAPAGMEHLQPNELRNTRFGFSAYEAGLLDWLGRRLSRAPSGDDRALSDTRCTCLPDSRRGMCEQLHMLCVGIKCLQLAKTLEIAPSGRTGEGS